MTPTGPSLPGAGKAPETPAPEPIRSFPDAVDRVIAKLQEWLDRTIELVPNFIVAVVIVLVFALVARLARKGAQKLFERVTGNPTIAHILGGVVHGIVVLVGVFFALGVLGLDRTVTSLLAGAGVVGIALAFAFQDLAANFMAGVYLSVKRPLRPGELVETNDTFGVVEHIDLRSTALRSAQGQLITLPNKDVFENKLTNYSRLGRRRVDLAVGVSYGEDLPKVIEITREAIETHSALAEGREVEVYFTGFGGSSIDLVVRFWIPFARQVEYVAAMSEAVTRVKRAYDENDIVIPFPIRTLDFGIKGGEKLVEMLPSGLAAGGAEPGGRAGEG